MGFPSGSDGKASVCNAGDPGSIPGLGRSLGEGNGSPLQYSCLGNPIDIGALWATVHGAQNRHSFAVQGTLKSLLQHHNFKASILQRSHFFMDQHSHLYMTTGKTIALTIWTFVNKVTSLLFNMLSRLIIAFLPRNKCLLISWQWSSSAGILKPKKRKSATVSNVSPSISQCHIAIKVSNLLILFKF